MKGLPPRSFRLVLLETPFSEELRLRVGLVGVEGPWLSVEHPPPPSHFSCDRRVRPRSSRLAREKLRSGLSSRGVERLFKALMEESQVVLKLGVVHPEDQS